ncbi:MAG: hypothetical protein JXQ97_09360 [Natronospirillum sp.]
MSIIACRAEERSVIRHQTTGKYSALWHAALKIRTIQVRSISPTFFMHYSGAFLDVILSAIHTMSGAIAPVRVIGAGIATLA